MVLGATCRILQQLAVPQVLLEIGDAQVLGLGVRMALCRDCAILSLTGGATKRACIVPALLSTHPSVSGPVQLCGAWGSCTRQLRSPVLPSCGSGLPSFHNAHLGIPSRLPASFTPSFLNTYVRPASSVKPQPSSPSPIQHCSTATLALAWPPEGRPISTPLHNATTCRQIEFETPAASSNIRLLLRRDRRLNGSGHDDFKLS